MMFGKAAKVIKNLRAIMALALLLSVSLSSFAQESLPPKIVIFYSSIGMGHISAARAIEQSIKERDPNALVILKNIRDFKGHIAERADEKLFWFVVKNFPNLFDKLFRQTMARGNQVNRLSQIEPDYDAQEVLKFIVNQNPTAIIATHYGSAQLLGGLREEGYMRGVPVAWLHTDYFKGYFPRISKQIDRTFVGMQVLRDQWIEEGLEPGKVVATGLPVNLSLFTPVDRVEFLTSKGLDPNVRTIVLASGGEGVGDFPLIVKKVAEEVPGPLQIIAVCARNEKHVQNLTKLKPTLRPDVRLEIHGMVPNAELLSYIKSANLYITKSGGLSPTEGFAINKPMVLLDVYGGHERENANLFEKQGLAVINRDQRLIGKQVAQVLESPETQEKMLRAQLAFRNSFNLKAIGDFAFEPRKNAPIQDYYLGIEGGEDVKGTKEALARLELDSPADIEIILSYGKSYDGNYFGPDSNPFGHLALRVGNKVYTANGRAQPGREGNLVHETSLQEYFYGVKRPEQNVEHTDAFGSSYGRNNLSIRVSGLKPAQLLSMQEEVARIQDEWRAGATLWSAKGNNCADFAVRIMKAGGIETADTAKFESPKHITMPLDVLESYRQYFEARTDLRSELVSYNMVPDSKNVYRSTRFPLSIHQLKRSFANLILRKIDPVELMVGKRIAFYSGDEQAYYENINGESQARLERETEYLEGLQKLRLSELLDLEKRIDAERSAMEMSGLSASGVQTSVMKELEAFTAEELSLVLADRMGEIPDASKRERATRVLASLKSWDERQTSHHYKIDRMIRMELDYFIKSTFFTMQALRPRLAKAADKKLLAAIDDKLAIAAAQYAMYAKNLDQYGLPKDGPLRTEPYRLFFAAAKSYFDLAQSDQVSQSQPVKSFWETMRTKARKVYSRVRLVMAVTPPMLNAMVTAWLRPVTGPNEAPLIESINKIFAAIGRIGKYEVKIDGAEFLPRNIKPDGKTVYLIAPTHRDPMLDAIVMANLGIENYMLAMAPDQIVPGKLADKLSGVDSVVAVGRGRDKPILKILEGLRSGKSNVVVIYPEGSVSAGLYETRPVREKFSWGLIETLRAEGYDVKLIPVTYQNTGRFAHENSIGAFFESFGADASTKELKVKVGQPIEERMLAMMAKATEKTAVGRFVRSIWLENLDTNANFLAGLLRPGAAAKLMNEKLGLQRPRGQMCELLFTR